MICCISLHRQRIIRICSEAVLVTFFMVAGFFGVLVYLIDVGSGVCLLLVATAISCVCFLIVLVSLSWNSVVLGSFGIAHGIACLCVCMFGLLVCIWC